MGTSSQDKMEGHLEVQRGYSLGGIFEEGALRRRCGMNLEGGQEVSVMVVKVVVRALHSWRSQ